jgi:hypothetical protein
MCVTAILAECSAEGAKEIEMPITTAETADPSTFVAHIKVSS